VKDFYFYKEDKKFDILVNKNISRLNNLYKKIPNTNGCLESICKEENGCGGWCCRYQSPQLLYIEFLNIWKWVIKNLKIEDVLFIIELSLKNYIKGVASKGCVFFDETTCKCIVHQKRPYACRLYGITPDEEFNPRYKKMKEEYKNDIKVVIRPQCDKVNTCNYEKISTEDTNEWSSDLIKIEKAIGIKKEDINDNLGGSYRTPHDHVLLYIMSDEILQKLQKIRLYANDTEKKIAIEQYLFWIKKKING
jgi:Fe-S-cluster containining protein